MRLKYIVGLALALVLMLTPLAVFAQDDEPELQEYVSEDELLSVMLPADWSVSPMQDVPWPAVEAANSEDLLAKLDSGEDPVSGDKAILIFVLPIDFFADPMMGLEIPEDATPVELAEALGPLFAEPDEGATDEEIASIEVSDAEEVELTDDLTAGYIQVSTNADETGYFVYELQPGLLAVIFVGAYVGELDDQTVELGRQAAASLSYEGTAEDILAAMMAPPEIEQSDVDPSTLDGEQLVQERCTVCHTVDRIDNADKDEAGWTATVDRMIGYGAQLNSAERQAVIDYLVETH